MEVEDVVLKLYRDLCVPTGGRLSHATLIKEWARTPLRADDLCAGLKRLEHLRHLQAVQSPDGIFYTLTGTGHERAAAQNHRLPQTIKLGLALRLRKYFHSRPQEKMPVAPRRRLDDRIVPQL